MRRFAKFIMLAAAVCATALSASTTVLTPTASAQRADRGARSRVAQDSGPETDAADGNSNLGVVREAGGLTADEAAKRAVETSTSVAQARAAQQVAEAASDRALVTAFPRIDLSARYTRVSNVKQGSLGTPLDPTRMAAAQVLIDGVADPNARTLFQGILDQQVVSSNFEFPQFLDQYALKATVTVPFSDIFLSAFPAHSATRAFAEAQELQVKASRQAVGLQARETFYSYVRARAALAVAEANEAQVASQRKQIDLLVSGGSLARVDLMRIDAQLAAARVSVEQSRGNVAVAAHALRTLLHLDKDKRSKDNTGTEDAREHIGVDVDLSTAPELPAGSRDSLIAEALKSRSEIKALERTCDGHDSSATAYAWQRAPHLSFQGNVDYANPNQRVFPPHQKFDATWDVSAIVSWSPNDFFSANADTNSEDAQYEQARAALDAMEDSIRIEVTSAWETLTAARASLDAAAAAVTAAAETLRVRQQQLAAGAIVSNDLIDAENDLTKIQLQQVDAVIQVYVARARLDRATGI